MKRFAIWYMRPTWFAEGIFGAKPDLANLDATHVQLRQLDMQDSATLDDVMVAMQGDVWSPNGEARDLIASLGLSHTSMSRGDVVVDADGVAHLVGSITFEPLGQIAA